MLNISDNLRLPLDTVTQSLAILARKRAGKSYTGRRFAETLLDAGQQVVILDPKGDWWGIRSGADGKTPGFPVVVLGGEHGDLPLERTAAETVARLIVEERVSVLLDLSDLKKYEIPIFLGGDLKRGGEGLLELLYRMKAKEEFRTPMMLIVDEADAIAPQKPNPGEERMLGAMDDIVRRGGQRGIGCMLISQRSAVVNKNVLTQTQVMIAMQTIARLDMDAIMDWVDVHGQVEQGKILRGSLPALPVGDAWVLSPGWPTVKGIFERIHVDRIRTFDSGATPKAGEKRLKPKNIADVDMEALKRRMAETIERAKAEDPRELQKQIAERDKRISELERAGKSTTPTVDKDRLKQEFERGFERGATALKKSLAGAVKKFQREFIEGAKAAIAGGFLEFEKSAPTIPAIEDLISDAASIEQSVEKVKALAGPVPMREFAQRMNDYKPPPKASASHNGTVAVSGMGRKILTVLAQFPDGMGLDRLAILAGSTVSGHFNNTLGGLRSSGYVTQARVLPIQATAEGLTALGGYEPLPTGRALREYWLNRLGGGMQSKIFGVLIETYPRTMALEELAAACGSTVSGHFNNTIGSLRTMGLMTPARTPIKASDDLFR